MRTVPSMTRTHSWLALIGALMVLPACARRAAEDGPGGPVLRIISGSENETLEPLVQELARTAGGRVEIKYLGSVDIALALEAGAPDADAVWPANSLWVVLGDRRRLVEHAESVYRSPVVFGVKRSVAEHLGWVGRQDVRVEEILGAAERGALRFAMTSATQSNSGASAYLGFLHALAGSPDVLTSEHLADSAVRDRVRRLLSHVDRSAGSSGWLKDLYLRDPSRLDAMVNYEALVIEANQQLVREGRETLWAVYPVDGLTIADSPLGYVDHGDAAKETLFLELQRRLLAAPAQARIEALGRRTGLLGLEAAADRAVFDPAWGIDPQRVVSPVPLPDEAVIRQALEVYQTALRKPSLTAYVLDYSGSMEGEGEDQLERAMGTLLDPKAAGRYLLQPSPQDVQVVVPFDASPRAGWTASGNDPAILQELLARVRGESADGGTDMYAGIAAALDAIAPYRDRLGDFFPAIIVMTDGRSEHHQRILREKVAELPFANDVPIFAITFGDADDRQLQEVTQKHAGRVFDGRSDLVRAFRQAKGYN